MNKKENKKSVSDLIVTIACIILVPILIINLWIIVQSKTNQDKVPSVFGYKPFLVLSGSMEGKILKGDLIITKTINPDKLKVNDIVAFRDAEGTVTTHRIIDEIEKDGERLFITKGDNNSTQDQNLVSLNDIEGIFVLRIPSLGSIMKSLSEPTTIMILMFGITILFGIGFMISTKKQQALERQEFLEYKRLKELEQSGNKTKKTKSKKAVEDEDEYDDDELLEEDEEEEEEKPKPRKKKTTSSTTKKTSSVKETSSKKTTKSVKKTK